ncbi:hypothetical protein AOLI_G00006040 [Acnodon oligacanthus]
MVEFSFKYDLQANHSAGRQDMPEYGWGKTSLPKLHSLHSGDAETLSESILIHGLKTTRVRNVKSRSGELQL